MTASEQEERVLLERLITLGMEANALDALFARLSEAGLIGTFLPAGDSWVALAAAGMALEDGDQLFGVARDIPAALARGMTLQEILLQAFAAQGDTSLGRGLPGALCHAERGVSLSDGSVATHLVHASGFGQAARRAESSRIALACFGNGAFEQGEIHAAFNFATVTASQVVYVVRGALADGRPMTECAAAWGIHAVQVDGDDGLGIYRAVRKARARAVAGDGPTVVDARLRGTFEPKDALALQALGGMSEAATTSARAEVVSRVEDARRQAETASFPPVKSLFEHVFSDRPWWLEEQAKADR